MQGLHNCLDAGVFTGVCTSLCQTNIDDLLQRRMDRPAHRDGRDVHVVPRLSADGPRRPNPDLCLTPEQQLQARKFVVEMRAKKPIVIIDAYHDGEGKALCPAATGISHHINPWGDIEPCPIVQFSKESIHATEADARPLQARSSCSRRSCADFRKLAPQTTRGCIVLERPGPAEEAGRERTGRRTRRRRQTALAELEAMTVRDVAVQPGGGDPGEEPASTGWRSVSSSTTSASTPATIIRRHRPPAYWLDRDHLFRLAKNSAMSRLDSGDPGQPHERFGLEFDGFVQGQ